MMTFPMHDVTTQNIKKPGAFFQCGNKTAPFVCSFGGFDWLEFTDFLQSESLQVRIILVKKK